MTHALTKGCRRSLWVAALMWGLLTAGCADTSRRAALVASPPPPVWRQPAVVRETPAHETQSREALAPQEPPVAAYRDVTLGKSVGGTPLVMRVFGHGTHPVLMFGGIHGSEPTSASLARRLMEHLEQHPRLCRDSSVAVLPAVNPDGLARNRRSNRHGVDLNRNFPAANWRGPRQGHPQGGSSPASEPETRALVAAVRSLQPRAIVAIHSIGRGGHCNNYDGPAEALARAMSERNGYPPKASIGYATPGSFGSWAGIQNNYPTITLELPRDLDDDRCWSENREALLAVVSPAPPPVGK